MGSNKLTVLGSMFIILMMSFISGFSRDMKCLNAFADRDAVEAWAKSTFLDGYRKYCFSHGNADVIVIIAHQASGMPSSEIFVFDRSQKGNFGLMLHRRAFYGILKVEETADGIAFVANTPVLIIPWGGFMSNTEQAPEFEDGERRR